MSKVKGYGQKLESCLKKMADLKGSLKKFQDMPIKDGISEKKVEDDGLKKDVNSALTKAAELKNLIDDIVAGIKSIDFNKKNKRFAGKVISNFLNSSI